MKVKTKLLYVFATAVFALCFVSCKKSTPPTVKIYDNAISVSYTSANVTGEVTDEGGTPVTNRGFIYGKQGEARQDTLYCGNGAGEFPTRLTNLEPNTIYNCMAFARNDAGISYSGKATFTTLPMAQSDITTSEPTDIGHTHATCGGYVNSDGGSEVTERGVCWATTVNPTTNNSHLNSGTGTGEFSINVTGLTANTTYHVRAYAVNSKGTAYGDDVTFKTIDYNLPSVITDEVTNISYSTATCGGKVTSNGGLTVTARGVCWSKTNQTPTVSDNHTTEGTGTGNFTSNLTGLSQNTTYYVRAYATNSKGTSYGEPALFKTKEQPPTGAVNGKFSINGSQQVWFSQGNLQYQASTHTWRFATHQYDVAGSANSDISQTNSSWIDLFGWGTSGWDCGNTYYRPWDSNTINSRLYGPYGSNNLTSSYANSDWGRYNAISNGGNQTGQWRTLTNSEWSFVLFNRNTASGIRYAKAQVAGVNGVILLPDDWSAGIYSLSNTNNDEANFNSNVIGASQWAALENAGAVFLPAAGSRYGTSVNYVGSDGTYWSASYYDNECARVVALYDDSIYMGYTIRCGGISVRLVYPIGN